MEINPNHPVTAAMNDQWHKIVALLMHKCGQTDIAITAEDLNAFMNSGYGAVAIRTDRELIELTLITNEQAEELAKQPNSTMVK